MRKICVVTGSRADYGLLRRLIKLLDAETTVKLQLVVTGTHLIEKFGYTLTEIEKDGVVITETVDLHLDGDGDLDIAQSIGTGIGKFAKTLQSLRPDILVLLGDRYEIFSAAVAATSLRIPIGHIHGGETTEGAMDEALRHSITKMARYHFVSAEPYRNRVIQLGESPESVFCVGAPGLDHLKTLSFKSEEKLAKDIGLSMKSPLFICTYHPVTLEADKGINGFKQVIKALESCRDIEILFTAPNADAGSEEIINECVKFCSQNSPRAIFIKNLGTQNYWSALRYAAAVIGNSSSGIIEAPSLHCATINVGDRQKGRLMASSVLSVPAKELSIREAIDKVLNDSSFQKIVKTSINPYGASDASRSIKDLLLSVAVGTSVIKKQFYDCEIVNESLVVSS